MPKVFVSYSHRDGKDGVMTSLRPLEKLGLISLWADDRILPGDDWLKEIDSALAEATAAVLLISPHFLASDFIMERELPVLLARAEAGRLTLLPVFLRASAVNTLEIPLPLKHLLRRQIPQAARSVRHPVLWLDWGTFGAGHGQAPLLPSQLSDWLRFASETLSHGPEDLRLVVFGTLESDNQAAITSAFQDIQRQPWCRRPEFRVTPLEPLQHVDEIDLLYHLEDSNSSSCPSALQTELAERIHRQTGGRFDATVALLEEAEKGSWYALIDRMRDEQGTRLPREETPL
jgi:TIR domain